MLADVIAWGLRREALSVDIARDGATALDRARTVEYDVIILDRDLPVIHGDEVCPADQLGCPTRILMLTASAAIEERVEGLALGAYDYLPKPFAMSELVARISPEWAAGRCAPARTCCEWRPLARSRVRRAGRGTKSCRLTNLWFALLEQLLMDPGATLSAEMLMERVWDYRLDPFSNIVRVTVLTLRRKLGDPPVIETVPGPATGSLRRENFHESTNPPRAVDHARVFARGLRRAVRQRPDLPGLGLQELGLFQNAIFDQLHVDRGVAEGVRQEASGSDLDQPSTDVTPTGLSINHAFQQVQLRVQHDAVVRSRIWTAIALGVLAIGGGV